MSHRQFDKAAEVNRNRTPQLLSRVERNFVNTGKLRRVIALLSVIYSPFNKQSKFRPSWTATERTLPTFNLFNPCAYRRPLSRRLPSQISRNRSFCYSLQPLHVECCCSLRIRHNIVTARFNNTRPSNIVLVVVVFIIDELNPLYNPLYIYNILRSRG